MTALTKSTTLGPRIQDNVRFLHKLAPFAERVCRERGVVQKSKQFLNNSHQAHECQDVGGTGISLYYESGQTPMGGNELKVWYHRGRPEYVEADLVLDIYWLHDIGQCEVRHFDRDLRWKNVVYVLLSGHKKATRFADQRAEAAQDEAKQQVSRGVQGKDELANPGRRVHILK